MANVNSIMYCLLVLALPSPGWASSDVLPLHHEQSPLFPEGNTSNARLAISTLQRWYNSSSGLWDTTGWWNSANALTTIADFAAFEPSFAPVAEEVYRNTFVKAQQAQVDYGKVMGPHSMMTFTSTKLPKTSQLPHRTNFLGFINDYYDDEGWWALAWLKIYDLTSEMRYLQIAMDIFADMESGWTSPCGGGLWWDKSHSYVGAIENELFLAVAASLANRAPDDQRQYYLQWALKQWLWFQRSGMINMQHSINNGLDQNTCVNDNGTIWTYNQGVILGGLVELHRAQPDPIYLGTAQMIATAAIGRLGHLDGILHEPCEPQCGADGPQFKGIFMRNLQKLHIAIPQRHFKDFINRNAASIWGNDRDQTNNQLGIIWSGPFVKGSASEHSSACDALIAAAACN